MNNEWSEGPHYEKNSHKLDEISDKEFSIAVEKCKRHIKYRLWGRTEYGAHTIQNLGEAPLDYYIDYAISSILYGSWEWKDDYDFPQQLIRIADSRISTVVESFRNEKKKNEHREKEGKYLVTPLIITCDIEELFYNLSEENFDEEFEKETSEMLNTIEEYVANSDDQKIKIFWEGIKEGLKRRELADLMDIKPKQLDKVREKFINNLKKLIDGEER